MERIARISSENTNVLSKVLEAVENHQEISLKTSMSLANDDQCLTMRNTLSKSKIDSLELNRFYQGEVFEDRRLINAFIVSEPEFLRFKPYQLSRDDARYMINILLTKLIRRFPISYEIFKNDYWKALNLFTTVGIYEPAISVKIGVHFFLYARTIQILGNEEQHRTYIERACSLQDFGCFTLTEMTHGSNVQGCITTATYDMKTDTFVINTPHERGCKFWIGNAGQTANMSIVFANLIVNNKNYGIYPFIVKIRNSENHHPMPGVTLVDCGDKMGLQGIDNGLLMFRRVVIPRQNLLNKVTQVDREGNVTSLFDDSSKRFAIQLSALSEGRVKVALISNTCAFHSCMVTFRYGAVTKLLKNGLLSESTLLDCPAWQGRMFPHFATNFTYIFGIRAVNNLWRLNSELVFDSKNNEVKEMHAIISVVKSLATIAAHEANKECCSSTGVFGSSVYSRLPGSLADCGVNITWEGDSYVLLQQTSRFLITQYMRIIQGKDCSFKTLEFLSLEPAFDKPLEVSKPEQLLEIALLEKIFEKRCLRNIQHTVSNLQQGVLDGSDPLDAWNNVIPQGLNDSAVLYGELYLLREAIKSLEECSIPQNRTFIENNIRIYALSNLKRQASLVIGYLSPEHFSWMPILLINLFNSVKYDIVSLYNECGISDQMMRSTIGSSEGNYYDRTTSETKSDKNNSGVPYWWKEIIGIQNSAQINQA